MNLNSAIFLVIIFNSVSVGVPDDKFNKHSKKSFIKYHNIVANLSGVDGKVASRSAGAVSKNILNDECSEELKNFIKNYVLANLDIILEYVNKINSNFRECRSSSDDLVETEKLNLTAIITSLSNLLNPLKLQELIINSTINLKIQTPLEPLSVTKNPAIDEHRGASLSAQSHPSLTITTNIIPATAPASIQFKQSSLTDFKKKTCEDLTSAVGNATIIRDFNVGTKAFKNIKLTLKNVSVYAQFGKGEQGDVWKHNNEIKESQIELLTDNDVKDLEGLIESINVLNNQTESRDALSRMLGEDESLLEIKSDLFFAVQNRDSKNPSKAVVLIFGDNNNNAKTSFRLIKARGSLDGIKEEGENNFLKESTICLDLGIKSDLTRFSLTGDRRRIRCFGSPRGNSCGRCGLPLNNAETKNLILKKVMLQPKGPGASTPDGQWRRNQYLFRGSFYFVHLKLFDCFSTVF